MNTTPAELARERECAYRRNHSCAHINAALGWTHSFPLDSCTTCFQMDPSSPEAAAYRAKVVDLTISVVKGMAPSALKPRLADALTRHLTPEEKAILDADPTLKAKRESEARWDRVRPSWTNAASFIKSLKSRGLANHRVPLPVLQVRRQSCGLEGSTTCPALRTSRDGTTHYCGECGCGDTPLAQLDGPGYTKLDYPYLECPRGMPGFSNGRMDPLMVFDGIVCVNLDRRPDRWESFTAATAAFGWPIHRMAAMDGTVIPMPRDWPSGEGAWGCFLSHRRILEDAVAGGVNSVLIFEDDCVFSPTFLDDFSRFLAEVPSDWDGLMVGGQHLDPPTPVSKGVVRCTKTNRTHAYAVRGRYLRQLLQDWESWRPEDGIGHVDHLMQRRHTEFKVYAPAVFPCGQAQGRSDILGTETPLRTWNPPTIPGAS